jgi:hypothetical protein
MIILELACYGLRAFRNVTKLTLKPGLNVIHGRTGTGKSTLFDCLQVVLLGLDPEPLRSGIVALNGSAQAAVTVRLRNGEVYRLVRDFAKGSFHILRWDAAAKTLTPTSTDPDTLSQLWQPESDGLPLETVRTLIAWSPRSVFTPTDAPAAADFTQGTAAPAALSADERAAKVTRLAELQTQLAQAERLAQSADERSKAHAEEAEARNRLSALDTLDVHKQELKAREAEMAPFLLGPKDLDAQVDAYMKALPALQEERATLEEDAATLSTQIDAAAARSLLNAPLFWVGAGVTGVSFLVAAFVPLTGWTQRLYLVGLGVGIALLVASLVLDFQRLGKKKSMETKRADLVRKASRLEDRLKKTYAVPAALIAQTGCPDAEVFKAKRKTAQDWAAECAKLGREEAARLGGKTREALTAEWQAVKARADAMTSQVADEVDLESLRDAIILLTKELDSTGTHQHLTPSSAPVGNASNGAEIDPLRAHAGEINVCLLRLSEERFDAVSARDGAVMVRRRNGTGEASLDALSTGEALQARIAIALGAWAARRAKLGFPLMLDDPLSYLDPQSRRVLLDTLTRLSANRQIIVFANGPVPDGPGIAQTALPAA